MQKKLSGKEIGETSFIVGYLLFLIVTGIISLIQENYVLFIMIALLGVGDSFHLIPRIKKNLKGDFPKSDFYLGLGNQISSITMTLFYLILFFIVSSTYLISIDGEICYTTISYIIDPTYEIIPSVIAYLTIIRIILCLLPWNNWYKKEGNQAWAVIRNIPFIVIGLITAGVAALSDGLTLPILIILSFLFYIPVALFAKKNPKLGMLMIPKTICYIIMILYLL